MVAGRPTSSSYDVDPPARPAPVAGHGECRRCGGVGFVRASLPVDHPDFGRAVECGCEASARVAAERARVRALSNLGPLYGARVTASEGASLPGYEAACRFADEAAAERWMVMTGASDDARLRLLAEMANRRISAGRDALYFTAADLLDRLRAAYQREVEISYAGLFEHLRDAPFLIDDDLDRANPTAWAREKMSQLLTDRQRRGVRTALSLRSASRDALDLGRFLGGGDGVLRVDAAGPATAEGKYRQVGGMTLEVLRRFTFGGFDADAHGARGGEANLRMMKSIVQAWADAPSGWLTLLGRTGVGKTHLAAAAAGARLAAGDSVYFAVAPDLFDALRETYGAGSEATFGERFAELQDAALLVLDDLHAQARSAWVEEKLYQLLARRYLQRQPTLITSNLGAGDLDQLSPRIASRLVDPQAGAVYEIQAADYRTGLR